MASPAVTPTPARQRLMSPPIPNSPSSPSSGSVTDRRRARRAELRQFYGLKGDAGGDQGEGKAQGGDPLDIDSPAFNPTAYYEDLIAASSLSGLMKTASALAADIGNLQSSRHALVYNHHHQLFAAGDTISHLNSRTPQLLGIMSNLQQSFSEISRLADDIALPNPGKAVEEKTWKKDRERLRLMVLAEEPAEKIKEYYESIREDLERDAADDALAREAMEECRKLVGVDQGASAE